jgi:hypothetical protein
LDLEAQRKAVAAYAANGRELEPAQILGVVQLAGHLRQRRVEVGLRHAHLGIARAHLTEVLVRRDPGRAVGRLEHAEHVAGAAPVLHVDASERLEAGRGEQPRLHVHLAFAVADVAARARRRTSSALGSKYPVPRLRRSTLCDLHHEIRFVSSAQ